MLDPKPTTITDQKGQERNYVLHKVPAVPMREIVAKYPTSNLPRIGDYAVSEETMYKLMAYVSVETSAGPMPLNSPAMVANHVPDWEVLARLELEMIEYNVSFFARARNSGSFTDFLTAQLPKILSTLTASLQASSQTDKQPSTN